MKEIKNYTRVTDALFPLTGLRNIDPEVLKRAANRGLRVHEICDAIIEKVGVVNLDTEVQGYIDSFKKWLPKQFIKKPDRFFCDKYMLTGECDAIYKDESGLVLVDFKTPASESKTWRLQGSAYSYLAKESGYNIARIEFVKLSKTGGAPKVYEYVEDFEMYLKCLDVYKMFFLKKEEPNPMDYM